MIVQLCAALAMLPCAVAAGFMGFATSKAVDATARQPEAANKINSILLMGLALTESTAILCFVTALLILVLK